MTSQAPIAPTEVVDTSRRLWISIRVGALAGGGFGLAGFMLASAIWAESAGVVGDRPYTLVITISAHTLAIAIAVASMVFGAVVAGVSRTAAQKSTSEAHFRSSPASTAWTGGAIGLVIGGVAGAVLASGFTSSVGGGSNLTHLHVLPTLAVMVVAGVVLGAAAAGVAQALVVPLPADDAADEQIEQIRKRLLNAVRVPVSAVLILVLLVVPLGWTLIQAAHASVVAAPVVAGIVALAILGFASLSGTRPNMRVTFGEFSFALVATLAVVGIALAVMFARGPAAPEVHGPGGTVTIAARGDISFDANAWTVPEGEVTFVYNNEGDLLHTLAIEGMEDRMELRVSSEGDVDTMAVNLPPGTYTLYCTIRGHRDLGMEGQLTVERAADEPPPP